MKKLLTAALALVTLGCFAANVYMAGDSTMESCKRKLAPRAGWGMTLLQFRKTGVNVINRGSGGASTHTYRTSHKAWAPLIAMVKPGDYVLLQFGHNDQKPNNPKKKNHVHCDPKGLYTQNLAAYIKEIKAKGGIPVLVTPVVRATFRDGKLVDTTKPALREYADAMLALAKKEGVACVDINKLLTEKFAGMTEKEVLAYYNFYAPGEQPNYPQGSKDRTHLQMKGAMLVAELFVADAKKQKLPIADLFK